MRALALSVVMAWNAPARAQPACGCELPQPSRLFAFAWGFGGVSRVGNASPTGGFMFSMRVGQRIADQLHIVERFDTTDDVGYSPDPTIKETHSTLSLGLRWSPLRRRRIPSPGGGPFPSLLPDRYFDMTALYTEIDVGLAMRERWNAVGDTTSPGPAAIASVGYLPIQGHDWGCGFDLREQLAHYSDGFQRMWSLFLVLQVNN